MIRRLQAGLGIPSEVLIQPYDLIKAEPARKRLQAIASRA